ncbi:transcriptional regulator of acetoin/glycerol metabolism [Spirosoma lacussanchae]|uniref:hypothetical protein n=1 Tax=Spirosoma lacussanchae TaxID=1884249 RepID=UPI00110950A7|nr:hypothetical protein [Spirosoma lacussanchae]
MNQTSKQLKAAYQLAQMAHQADPTNERKKAAYEQAKISYEETIPEEPVADPSQEPVADSADKLAELEKQLFLKNQQIEKLTEQVRKLEQAQKSPLPGKAPAGKATGKPAATPTDAPKKNS